VPEPIQKAVFLDRDGVVNEDLGWISRPDQLKVFSFAGPAIRRLNEHGWRVFVVTNQSAVARGWCTREDVECIHHALTEHLARDGARIDAVYYCPHHPDHGAVRDCNCRKPKTGLIDQGLHEFGIARRQSFLVGDKTSDVLAGRRAGLRTILVRTGEGGRDGLWDVAPDRTVMDLREAVDWILSEAGERSKPE
jgi:histidinol-phosphate phosphatase family protein